MLFEITEANESLDYKAHYIERLWGSVGSLVDSSLRETQSDSFYRDSDQERLPFSSVLS